MDQFGGVRRRNRRVGLILALLIVLYIARGDCLYHCVLKIELEWTEKKDWNNGMLEYWSTHCFNISLLYCP